MQQKKHNHLDEVKKRVHRWYKERANSEIIRSAETLPLKRDMETLLTYVRDNKVVGTKSRGNMPLKAVREVTARFVDPPRLDFMIGDKKRSFRSEEDIWSLLFLRILAEGNGLLKISPARRWRFTEKGSEFLEAPALLQLSVLLITWWSRVNWIIAYPYTGMGDSLPPYFKSTVLGELLSQPVKTRVSFESFANKLIKKTALTWGAQDSQIANNLLQGSIERMVIRTLSDFGAVESEYRDKSIGTWPTSKLVAFQITPLGRFLLESVT